MDREAWRTTVYEVAEWDMTQQLSTAQHSTSTKQQQQG